MWSLVAPPACVIRSQGVRRLVAPANRAYRAVIAHPETGVLHQPSPDRGRAMLEILETAARAIMALVLGIQSALAAGGPIVTEAL